MSEWHMFMSLLYWTVTFVSAMLLSSIIIIVLIIITIQPYDKYANAFNDRQLIRATCIDSFLKQLSQFAN